MAPRSKKAPKDPNAPKKPLSAYFIFSKERRSVIMAQDKSLRTTVISKMIAEEWKKMDESTKDDYKTKSNELKKAYGVTFEEYKQTDSFKIHSKKLKEWKEEQKLTKKTKKKKRKGKPKAPKKPEAYPKSALSAYFLFQNDRRKQISLQKPKPKTTEITKQVAIEWKQLKPEQKEPYDEKAKSDKIIFNEQMSVYKLKNEYTEYIANVKEYKRKVKIWENQSDSDIENNGNDNLTTKGAIKKLRLPKKPSDKNAPKKPVTAYILFSNDERAKIIKKCRENNEAPKVKEIQKQIGKLWQGIDIETKQKYSELSNNYKKEYQIKIAEYKESDNYTKHLEKLKEWKTECERKKSEYQIKSKANVRSVRNDNNQRKRGRNKKNDDSESSSDDSSSDDSDDSSSDDSSSDDTSDESSSE